MPNFISYSSETAESGAAAQDSLQLRAALAPSVLAELREAHAGLLDRHRHDVAVFALLRAAELVLDVAQMEPLLRHHAFQRLAILAAIERAEVRLELVVRQALDGGDRGERHDPPDVRRQLLRELAVATELLRAVREEGLDLVRHRLRLDAQAIDPVGEDARVPSLVAMVDLHRLVQLAFRAHLVEQASQAD